ncbi:hypothetical protein [Bathymodiolus japonicus methanotrophic gill symbiont]|uniref:hypothetical protein n=1 Tax=Bathymodiolus japonicus methanotrophic gill symbiont TaxID=113269 RepID=UPI001C8DB638|nr:hypothetical protein [Bathymodiolus japonicus methanotrophic gill symbiont]
MEKLEHRVIAKRGEGELIDIRSLKMNTHRSATVVAETYVTCLHLSAQDILRFSTECKVLGERLQKMGLLKN